MVSQLLPLPPILTRDVVRRRTAGLPQRIGRRAQRRLAQHRIPGRALRQRTAPLRPSVIRRRALVRVVLPRKRRRRHQTHAQHQQQPTIEETCRRHGHQRRSLRESTTKQTIQSINDPKQTPLQRLGSRTWTNEAKCTPCDVTNDVGHNLPFHSARPLFIRGSNGPGAAPP